VGVDCCVLELCLAYYFQLVKYFFLSRIQLPYKSVYRSHKMSNDTNPMELRLRAALGSILTLMGYDPRYRPPIRRNACGALGSIPFGAQKI
jgi:hypothetical protein